MPQNAVFFAFLAFLIATGCESRVTDFLLTCNAGSYEEGEAGSVSCDLHAGGSISMEGTQVYMERFLSSVHPEPRSGSLIFECSLPDNQQHRDCNVSSGYKLSRADVDHVTLKIEAVTPNQAGIYMCYVKPSDGTRPQVCTLTVKGVSGAGETEEKGIGHNLWATISVILILVTLCLIFIIVFICCRRRLVRKAEHELLESVRYIPSAERADVTPSQPLLPNVKTEVKTALSKFELSVANVKTFMELMDEQLCIGLQENVQVDSDVKMLPTFVRFLPDGTETGAFLVVAFGSENLVVMLVDLKDTDMRSTKTEIPQQVKVGTSVQLFDFIADGVMKFITSNNIHHKKLPLVFVFSFPCKQDSLTQACLTEWTKGFNCSGVVGQDLGQMLSQAFERKSIGSTVHVVAIMNNGVDKLLSVAQSDHNCRVGLVIGNGFNACYMDDHVKHMIINTEWGGLGNNGCLDFIKTEFDKELDSNSINPRKQTLEKMVSRMYMGELLRLVLEKLHKDGLLFRDVPHDCALFRRDGLDGSHVPKIESDTDEHYVCTNYMLKEMGLENYTEEDCRVVHYACTIISERAACLAGAALATLINRMDRTAVTVAVEGPVYRFHPHFKELLSAKMDELVNPCLRFKLVSSHGRRGLGAALAGAMAQRGHEKPTGQRLGILKRRTSEDRSHS